MFMLFKNSFRPYRRDDLARKQKFDKIVESCKKAYEQDECFGTEKFNYAFKYSEEQIAAELIARVPEVLVSCPLISQLKEARKNYHELFDYYSTYIVNDIEAALSKEVDSPNCNSSEVRINKEKSC